MKQLFIKTADDGRVPVLQEIIDKSSVLQKAQNDEMRLLSDYEEYRLLEKMFLKPTTFAIPEHYKNPSHITKIVNLYRDMKQLQLPSDLRCYLIGDCLFDALFPQPLNKKLMNDLQLRNDVLNDLRENNPFFQKLIASRTEELFIREKTISSPTNTTIWGKKHMATLQYQDGMAIIEGYLLKRYFTQIPESSFVVCAGIDCNKECLKQRISIHDSGPYTLLVLKPDRIKFLMDGKELCTAYINTKYVHQLALDYLNKRLYFYNYNNIQQTLTCGYYDLANMRVNDSMIASNIGAFQEIFTISYNPDTDHASLKYDKKRYRVHGFCVPILKVAGDLRYFSVEDSHYSYKMYPIRKPNDKAMKIRTCCFSGNTIRCGIQEHELYYKTGFIQIDLSTDCITTEIAKLGSVDIVWNDYFAHITRNFKGGIFDVALKEQFVNKAYENLKSGTIENAEFLNNRILKIEIPKKQSVKEIRLYDVGELVDFFKAVKH